MRRKKIRFDAGSKVFASTQRILKGGKQLGEDVVEITAKIRDLRMRRELAEETEEEE